MKIAELAAAVVQAVVGDGQAGFPPQLRGLAYVGAALRLGGGEILVCSPGHLLSGQQDPLLLRRSDSMPFCCRVIEGRTAGRADAGR